ncbi:diacylglycerol/lipid kinase family protein [Olsenella massiliensis]|uniref:diacylglycerol/lipid kinase family protein n=1 Tax=Olsenella massiliensis TaxID=1622075 RepID=UPI00071E497D|nr:diacylglycerol kinase family protein [Olsenella massiliensis]
MAHLRLGRTLVLANPTARSGKGATAATFVQRFFESYASITTSFDLVLTERRGHATQLATRTQDVDTLVVLGGDGIIHEAVGGVMTLPRHSRPTLAVIPMGSGNDFARTLHAAINDAETALAQIVSGKRRHIDLGLVTSDAGEAAYVAQTLSFGLDAAIALDTTRRREANTRQRGSALFATSGLKIFSSGSQGYPARLSIDGGAPQELQTLVMAIQNGPSYGGGFRVCPDAVPTDGLLDICYNVLVPSTPRLLALFALARVGKHASSSAVRFGRLTRAHVEFVGEEPPCQVDGEPLLGRSFDVRVLPDALDVIAPAVCPW